MIVVSNTTPLCYLRMIDHEEILPKLYSTVHITQTVLNDLQHPKAPLSVRNWVSRLD